MSRHLANLLFLAVIVHPPRVRAQTTVWEMVTPHLDSTTLAIRVRAGGKISILGSRADTAVLVMPSPEQLRTWLTSADSIFATTQTTGAEQVVTVATPYLGDLVGGFVQLSRSTRTSGNEYRIFINRTSRDGVRATAVGSPVTRVQFDAIMKAFRRASFIADSLAGAPGKL